MENSPHNKYEESISKGYSELGEEEGTVEKWGRGEYKGRWVDFYSDSEFIRDSFTNPILIWLKEKNISETDSVKIMDAGGGDGIVLNTILKKLEQEGFSQITGIVLDSDTSGRNFDILKKKKESGEYSSKLEAVKGDIFHSPVQGKSVDIVISRRVIQYFLTNQHSEFLNKMRESLKDDGLAVIEWPAGEKGLDELFEEITTIITGDKQFKRNFPAFHDFHPTNLPDQVGLEIRLGWIMAQEYATPESFQHRFNLEAEQVEAIRKIFDKYLKKYPRLFIEKEGRICLKYNIANCILRNKKVGQ
jgi:SAM-dependent methyltransferase